MRQKVAPAQQTPYIDQQNVPTPRQRSSVGTVMPPGTETVFINHYQAPDPGQISIPNPGLRTRPALHYHQIHGNPMWYWQDWDLDGSFDKFDKPHTGPYEERPSPPSFDTGRVAVGRRMPVTVLRQVS